MNLNRITAAGTFAIGVAVTAFAQTNATPDPLDPDTESVRPLPPIVVSATRTEQDPRSLGSAVTVVTAQELADSRVNTVLEALRQVPGVEVVQSGGPGHGTSVFIRGHNSAHTLIMLDGVRLNSNTAGGYDVANIPVNNIERLEIVRGAQGALYGSDAVGGVVNIVTKRGTKGLHGSVESAAGTGGYRSGGVALNGGNEAGDFSVGYSGNRFNGTSVASKKTGNNENDEWINHAFSGRFGLNFLEDGRADLTLNHSRDNADVDGVNAFLKPADDLNAEQRRRNLSGKFTVSKPVVDWYTQTLSVGLARENIEGIDPDTAGNNFTINNETRTFSAKSDFMPFTGDTVSVGYDFESQHGANPDSPLDQTLAIHSVFLQNHWTYEDIASVTAGIRHDNHETFGGYTTYRLAASAKVPDTGLRFHGSLGTGFRAPTLNDLYWPNTGWSLGNPNLAPETSKSVDLGVEQSLWENRVIADVTFFRSRVKNLIDWAATGPNWWDPWMPQNVANAEIQGIETSLILRPIRPLDLKLAYTLTDARDAATGDELARRPRHCASASATYRVFKGASITLSGTRVGERYDNKPNVDTLDSYVRFDLAATYDVTENLQFFGRIENMFDENYEEAKGYGITGRYAFLGAKLSF
jgi:vitamin B12 transporter